MPVFVVDKPPRLTSHDVVSRARRLLGTRRVGHTGTLDPLATGVLVLCAEGATKLVQFMEADSKDYLVWISLGASTPTLDAEGPVEEERKVEVPDAQRVEQVLKGFLGPQRQVPPQYSALQVGGRRAYKVARDGGALDLPAREVVIHDLRLLGIYPSLEKAPTTFVPSADGAWRPDSSGRGFSLPSPLGEFPTVLAWARVGSGTYLRSLARDVGAALGLPAHLAGLVRTRVGRFTLEEATQVEDLPNAPGYTELDALDLPRLEVTPTLAKNLRDGKRPQTDMAGRFAAVLEGELIAVVDADGREMRVVRAWV